MARPTDELITSLTNPRVKRVVRLRKPRERRKEGVLIAEGCREVGRGLAAGLAVVEAFGCDGGTEDIRGFVAALRSPGFGAGDVTWVSEAVFRKMAYHEKPEGVLAVFEAPRWQLDDMDARGLVLVAVGTEKPGNLGAMVRTAAAAGCDAVIAVGPAVDVFNPNAIRNSTGAVFQLPTVVVEDEAEAIAWLKSRGVTVAAALAEGGHSCFEVDLGRRPLALVVGPEHAGLGEAWRSAADVAVTIPSAEGGVVDSLNASNAAAVLMFEAVRQGATRA